MNSPTLPAALLPWSERSTCRLCGGALEELCAFGELSLTSRFPRAGEVIPKIPMTFMGCATCGLRQLRESTNPHEVRLRQLAPKYQGLNSTYWQTAKIHIRHMIAVYAECVQRYGEQPWGTSQQVEIMTDEDFPQQAY